MGQPLGFLGKFKLTVETAPKETVRGPSRESFSFTKLEGKKEGQQKSEVADVLNSYIPTVSTHQTDWTGKPYKLKP